jgi:hypothetical protein
MQSDPSDRPVLGHLAPAHHLTPLQVQGPEYQMQIDKVSISHLDPSDRPVLGYLAPAHHLTPLQVQGPGYQMQEQTESKLSFPVKVKSAIKGLHAVVH